VAAARRRARERRRRRRSAAMEMEMERGGVLGAIWRGQRGMGKKAVAAEGD
jgi:hypothetical protein